MATYIVLTNFTDQGIRTATESVKRARQSESTFEKFGAKKVAQYWTIGQHDLVTVLEAPNDEAAMRAVLAVGRLGNVRTTTMRAFTAQEMEGIVSGL